MKPTILQEIFETKKRRVAERRESTGLSDVMASAYERRAVAENHRLRKALSRKDINIIAEIKRASPSKGIINDGVDAAATALIYEGAGAKAISVLTEEDYFKGSIDDLRSVRNAVSLPVLQKDFIFDEFQIYEAAAAGADALLLIVAMLDDETLANLHGIAEDRLGIDALVEVHDHEGARKGTAHRRPANRRKQPQPKDFPRLSGHLARTDRVGPGWSGHGSRERVEEPRRYNGPEESGF